MRVFLKILLNNLNGNGKDFNAQDSASDNCEQTTIRLLIKRLGRDSMQDYQELRPLKKTKYSDSCTSSTSDLTDNDISPSFERSLAPGLLSSTSDTSFKSTNSNSSFQRRNKSHTSLFRDALQGSQKSINLSKHNYSESSTPGGTPRKERNHRRNTNTRAWKILDICTWIGRKGFQSITGLYNESHREPIAPCEAKAEVLRNEELKKIHKLVEEVNQKQSQLEQENNILKENMKMMMSKIEELERDKLRCQSLKPQPACAPPPPPPPPPSSKPLAPSRITAPRFTITPQDIANVKLRKAKDNPIRTTTKSATQQPLVTPQMLQSTRAKLGRARPVAASTPKQQLSELEKCILQEPTVTSLLRRRVARTTFRGIEKRRPRQYSPCSPNSPRPNSSSRVNRRSTHYVDRHNY